MQAPGNARKPTDVGMSMVELLIYLGLLVVVVVILGGLLINLLNVQKRVVNGTSAAQQAQSIAQALQVGVRNATAIKLVQIGSTDQMVSLRSAQSNSPASYVCIAYYFSSANGGSLRYQRSAGAIATPSVGQLASWTLLGQGLTGTQSGQMFALAQQRLSFGFVSRLQSSPATTIQSIVTARGGPVESAPCF
jgi:hypothetical protein